MAQGGHPPHQHGKEMTLGWNTDQVVRGASATACWSAHPPRGTPQVTPLPARLLTCCITPGCSLPQAAPAICPATQSKAALAGKGVQVLGTTCPPAQGALLVTWGGSANTGHALDTAGTKGRNVTFHSSFRHPWREGNWCLGHKVPFSVPHQLHTWPDGLSWLPTPRCPHIRGQQERGCSLREEGSKWDPRSSRVHPTVPAWKTEAGLKWWPSPAKSPEQPKSPDPATPW